MILFFSGVWWFVAANATPADSLWDPTSWDDNRDGVVQAHEVKSVMGPQWVQRVDRDRDGILSKEEFQRAQVQRGRLLQQIRSELPSGTRITNDIVYSSVGRRHLHLDLYQPPEQESAKPVPLIIWIHGGAWRSGSKDHPGASLHAVKRGFAIASIEYRLSGEATFPAAIEDCKAAVSFLRANASKYQLRPDRFAVWGASAGGHLASLLGTTGDVAEFSVQPVARTTPSSVQAVCNWFGPSDFLRMNDFPSIIDHDAADSPESQFIGGPIQENQDKVRLANPISYVTASDPPMLHVHGTDDRLVPINQSQLLHSALQKGRIRSELHAVPRGNHGFSKGDESRQELIDVSLDFIDDVFRTLDAEHESNSRNRTNQSVDKETSATHYNVLLIVADDLRADVLGCYGNSLCQTPNIDRLAQRGMVFERAYCQGTACGPSRTSFMFSRYRGAGGRSMGEFFRDNGYHAARVGKIFHMRVPGDIIAATNGPDVIRCWDERFNSFGLEAHSSGEYACLNLNVFTRDLHGRQSTAMPHRAFVSVVCDGDGHDQPDYKTATKTIELLRENQDRPFLIAAGFVRPHYPMVAPKSHFDRYPWKRMTLPPQVPGDLDDIPRLGLAASRSETNGIARFPDNQRRMWSAYLAATGYMDAQVGRVLDELDRLQLQDKTIVAFVSDHGYHLGEHTFWQKANLHEQVIHVPLIISAPGLPPERSSSIVELVDLYPTLCDLAGWEPDRRLEGTSLKPLFDDPSQEVKESAISFSRGQSLRTTDWAYMEYPDGSAELYDMRSDPDQLNNLASKSTHRPVLDRLRSQLRQRLRQVAR